MTVVPIVDYHIDVSDRVKLLVWEGLTTNDTGIPVSLGIFPDRAVQIFYQSGSGATIIMQGSNDPRANPKHADHASAVWFTIKDSGENLISTTTNAGYQGLTSTYFVRPSVSGGSTPDIDVALYMTRAI